MGSDHNVHAKRHSYHQACTNATTAQQYLYTRGDTVAPGPTYAKATSTQAIKPATCSTRVFSYHIPTISAISVETAATRPIIRDPELHMSAVVGGRTHGCICVFCEHRFAHEMRSVYQVERRAMDFHNDTIHGDYCKKCLQSGGIMRLLDVNGQNLGVIRKLLMDLIDARHFVSAGIEHIID